MSEDMTGAKRGALVRFWQDELKHVPRHLYEQQWPAPSQALIDAVKEFGEARALELDRQAHRRSRTANDSYDDQLEMLVRSERLSRAIDAANRVPSPLRPEHFSVSLRGWPRRGL